MVTIAELKRIDEQKQLIDKMAREIAKIAGVEFDRLPLEYKERNIRAADRLLSLVEEAGYTKK